MKKLLAFVFAVLLLVVPVRAGQIESPGFAEPQYEAPAGAEWIQLLDGLWYLFTF